MRVKNAKVESSLQIQISSLVQQRGHLSAHASEGQCVVYANREILAELKIESVNIMVIRRHPSTVQNKTANTLKITKFLFIKVFFIHWVLHNGITL